MISLTRANSMAAVMLAATRAAERGHEQHGRGLTLLATISATAPFVGVLGTLYWILSLFSGVSGEIHTFYRFVKLGISHSLWFTAAGLLTAVVSYAGYRYFQERREEMRCEMRAAVMELVNTLRVCFADRFSAEPAKPYRESRSASAGRAMERSARSLSQRLRRRIPKLTSIAATAPMIGTLALVFGFIASFKSLDVDRAVLLLTGGFSEAFVPMAFALIAAIIATWSRNYLLRTSADMDAEIRVTSNELLNTLALTPTPPRL
jgi:biopolymer transport protein ExbB/TolQ